jgi:hypothetical protein
MEADSMNNAAATAYRNAAGGSDHDKAPYRRLAARREQRLASQTNTGMIMLEPEPVPDPTWDPVTHASWESFPASDAPGWR